MTICIFIQPPTTHDTTIVLYFCPITLFICFPFRLIHIFEEMARIALELKLRRHSKPQKIWISKRMRRNEPKKNGVCWRLYLRGKQNTEYGQFISCFNSSQSQKTIFVQFPLICCTEFVAWHNLKIYGFEQFDAGFDDWGMR